MVVIVGGLVGVFCLFVCLFVCLFSLGGGRGWRGESKLTVNRHTLTLSFVSVSVILVSVTAGSGLHS